VRLENSARNLAIAWLGQALYVVVNFVTLGIFASLLSTDYNGVQGLFTQVLTILSLSELGVGSAIIYALYKPLAEGDTQKVRSLMRLFKRAYVVIGVVIALFGFGLAPFIQHLIKGSSSIPLDELRLYFVCFVLNSSVSYFFSYKGSLLFADQKKYLVSMVQYGFQIVMCCSQIVVLLLTHNYLLFLVCMVCSTLGQNMVTAHIANRRYPYIKAKTPVEPIDAPTLATIKKNVFALVLHRIAGIATTPASSLIISLNINLLAVASYGYYTMVVTALVRIMDQLFDAILASVGNLAATESSERQLGVFKTTFFINAILYAVTAIPLLCVFNVFIGELWVGEDYLLPVVTCALITILYYLKGMRSAALSFTSAYGLYWFTRYKAIIETVVLLVLCVVLVVDFDIAGVVIAGIITTLAISTVYEGYMLFKHGLKSSSRWYFLRFALYVGVTAVLGAGAYGICWVIPLGGALGFLVKGAVALAVSGGGFALLFGRTPEFRECTALVRRLARGLKGRLKRPERS
jgi:O-antigen/teichoic acid export membrane protein